MCTSVSVTDRVAPSPDAAGGRHLLRHQYVCAQETDCPGHDICMPGSSGSMGLGEKQLGVEEWVGADALLRGRPRQ